jgi:hypothetical protein
MMNYEYKSITNNSALIAEKQIKQADQLTMQGWKVLQVESYKILLERTV